MNTTISVASSASAPLSPDECAHARREYALLRRLAVAAIVLSCAVALSLNLVDPDLWGHVRYGQDWLAEGQLPRTATHTFTAIDYPWINHENVAELAFAVGADRLGGTGMLIAKTCWGLAILGLMAVIAHWHHARPLVTWAFLLLVANNLTAFFPLRPQLLSFMCLAWLLVALDRAFANWSDIDHGPTVRWPWLFAVPPIFILWVNSHGAFLAGLCILAAYFGGRCVEAIAIRGWHACGMVLGMAGVGVAALVATLVNPYGVELLKWIVYSLWWPRPEVTEWAAPTLADPVFWPFVMLAGLALGCFTFTTRKRDWTQFAILALVGWQAATHLRHIAVFAILCGFWLPVEVDAIVRRARASMASALPVARLAPWLKQTMVTALIAAIGLQCVGLYQRLSELPVYRHAYPVDALQFMADRDLHGRLVPSFNWAQYAIAALAPAVQVSFDGRYDTCYPQHVIDMNFDFLLGEHGGRRFRAPDSGAIDGRRVLSYRSPEMVLVDRAYPCAEQEMADASAELNSRWVLLYQDAIAQLWGLREVFDDPNSLRYLPPEDRVIHDLIARDAVPWPALPRRYETADTVSRGSPDPAESSTAGLPAHSPPKSSFSGRKG
ncbi:MAG: hypothetical protein WD851_21840 [Pirellulales bacterium]